MIESIGHFDTLTFPYIPSKLLIFFKMSPAGTDDGKFYPALFIASQSSMPLCSDTSIPSLRIHTPPFSFILRILKAPVQAFAKRKDVTRTSPPVSVSATCKPAPAEVALRSNIPEYSGRHSLSQRQPVPHSQHPPPAKADAPHEKPHTFCAERQHLQ